MTIGSILIILGFMLVAIFGSDDLSEGEFFQNETLVDKSESGDFTTSYNDSWYVEVLAYDLMSCDSLQLTITDSDGKEMYDGECYGGNQEYVWTYITSFQHQQNETYTFSSSDDIMIQMIYGELYENEVEGIAAIGGLSCFCGIVLLFMGSIAALINKVQPVGVMPVNSNGLPPNQNNLNNGQVIQLAPTNTYMTQPTIVEENKPQSFVISKRETPVQELDLNVNSKRVKVDEEPKQKSDNFWDQHV